MRNHKGQFIKGVSASPATQFKKGVSVSLNTQFKKGMKPWNTGIIRVATKVCQNCKEEFTTKMRTKKIWFTRKYCSFKCAGLAKRKGIPICRNCGDQVSHNHDRCFKCFKVNQFSNKKPTSIEKIVYEYLLSQGVIFETQKLINDKFIVDAYIPARNMVIEIDGNYWHSLDRVVKKDKAENAYLTKCGFNLLRLTETEVNNEKFKERVGVQN